LPQQGRPARRAISRPAISEKRLSLTPNGNVRYQLKTPYRDGTTHVIFEPLDFIARLAALVPKPRVHLTRFHGVFAPNSKYRARVTLAKRGRGGQHTARADREEELTPGERSAACSIDRDDPATTLRGCADYGAATMPAGRVAEVGVKSAPTSQSPRRMRVP
jgi:hypothetical protein